MQSPTMSWPSPERSGERADVGARSSTTGRSTSCRSSTRHASPGWTCRRG